MKIEDLAMKMSYKDEVHVEKNFTESPVHEGRSNIHRFDFSDDEEEENNYRLQPVFSINMKMAVVMYLIFVGSDLFSLLVFRQYLMLIPLTIHAIFLPILTSLVLKQKKFGNDPALIGDFIDVNLRYILFYIITRIVVGIIMFDFFSIIFLGLIGLRIIMTWYRLSRMMKLAPR